MLRLVVALVTLSAASTSAQQLPETSSRFRDVTTGEVTAVYPAACAEGLYRQPNGPFGVIVFCDGALGTHVAVSWLDTHDPTDGKWSLWDRFWQEDRWSSDATSIAWEPGGARLFIATGSVYGSATVWVIEPLERQARSLLVQEPPDVCGVTLTSIDPNNRLVRATLSDCEREDELVEVRY